MKTRKLLFNATKLAMAASLLMTAGTAIAGISTTKHNLGSAGSGPNTFSGTAEICVFCHTPHGSASGETVPLWNKTLPLANTFTTYDTLGTSSLDGATAPVGSVSVACLSCHDGAQAMDSMLNAPGSGTTALTGTWTGSSSPTGIANIGKDLRNDHPVGIQYGGGNITVALPTAATKDTDFVAPKNMNANGTTVWWVDTAGGTADVREKTDMQLYTRTLATVVQPFVECASCHDPHSNNDTFLRISNASSAVCLACHVK